MRGLSSLLVLALLLVPLFAVAGVFLGAVYNLLTLGRGDAVLIGAGAGAGAGGLFALFLALVVGTNPKTRQSLSEPDTTTKAEPSPEFLKSRVLRRARRLLIPNMRRAWWAAGISLVLLAAANWYIGTAPEFGSTEMIFVGVITGHFVRNLLAKSFGLASPFLSSLVWPNLALAMVPRVTDDGERNLLYAVAGVCWIVDLIGQIRENRRHLREAQQALGLTS